MSFNKTRKRNFILVLIIMFSINSLVLYAGTETANSPSQILGDCNYDSKVTIDDLVIVALHFGTQKGDLRYKPDADVNNDGFINMNDVSLMKENYGKLTPSVVPIIAVAGQNIITYKTFNVVLDGATSFIAPGRTVSYKWRFIEKTEGSTATINNQASISTYFIPDVVGIYKVGLTINDEEYYSRENVVNFTVKEIGDTTDTIDVSTIGIGKSISSSYNLSDMIPLSDGWVITKDVVNKKVVFYNPIFNIKGKEYTTSYGAPNRIEIDFERNLLYASITGINKIAQINLKTDEITYISVSGPVTEMKVGENGIIFVMSSNGSSYSLQVLDTETQAIANSTTITDNYSLMVYDKYAKNLVLGRMGSSAASLERYTFDSQSFNLKKVQYLWDGGSNALDLSISNDGKHIAFSCGGGNGTGYTIYDINSSDIASRFGEWNTGAYPTSAYFSLDDKHLVASDGSKLKIFSTQNYGLIKTITRANTDSYDRVYFSRGGKLIYDTVGQKLDIFQSGIEQTYVAPPVYSNKPISMVGLDKVIFQGFNVQLDGSKSRRVEGTTLTYTWDFVSKPENSQAALKNADSPLPSFVPDLIGDYKVSLVVNNGLADSDKKIINVMVKDIASTIDDIDLSIIDNMPQNSISGYTGAKPVALSDGWLIAVSNNNIVIFNALSGDIAKSYQMAAAPTSIDFDFEQKRIISTLSNTNKVAVINLSDDIISYINTPTSYTGITYGEDNTAFAVSSTEVSAIDLTQKTVVHRLTESIYGGHLIKYDKYNNNLILAEKGLSPSALFRYSYNAVTKQLRKEQEVSLGSNGINLAISNDGKHIAFSCGGGNGSNYTIFDVDSSDITRKFGEWNTGAYPTSAVFTNDNQYLMASNGTDLKLFEVSTHYFVTNIGSSNNAGNYDHIFISRGDKIIYDMAGTVLKFLANKWPIQ